VLTLLHQGNLAAAAHLAQMHELPLRAYPNNPAALNATRPQAK
jgi:hypothetical protein